MSIITQILLLFQITERAFIICLYLRSNILYIKWEYGADISKTDIHECINFVHRKCQPNAELVSLIGMLNELIDTRDDFKVITNLGKNEIIEYIISIYTISLS